MSTPTRPEKKRISARDFLVATRGPYRRLFGFLSPYRSRFILGLVCGALFGALNGLLIYTLGHVSNEVLPKEEPAGRSGLTIVETWYEHRELPELTTALALQPEAVRAEALEAYRNFREHLHNRSLEQPSENETDPLAALTLPDSLPPEFRLCLEGERLLASKGLAGETPGDSLSGGLASKEMAPHVKAARDAWRKLLSLPEKQRRHRTVWARYLLAHTEPDKNARTEQLLALHEDVKSGKFTDVLNLATLAPKPKPLSRIILLCLALPALMIVRALFGYLNAYWLTWVSLRVLNDIRSQLFQRILGQSMEFFNKQKSGDLMQTILNQTRVAQETLSTVAGLHRERAHRHCQCPGRAVLPRLEVHADDARPVPAAHCARNDGG